MIDRNSFEKKKDALILYIFKLHRFQFSTHEQKTASSESI